MMYDAHRSIFRADGRYKENRKFQSDLREAIHESCNCIKTKVTGSAMYRRKSWREKLADSKGLPKIGRITGRMSKRWGEGTMVIPAPAEVDAIMKTVPKGRLITINEIRQKLAREHDVSIACPITTGIFAWISAHAAEEDAAGGKSRITPYWRTLKSDGTLNPKYPGGIKQLKAKLHAEGHRVIAKGKNFVVRDYQKKLMEPA
jgi:hypothetical protein